MFMITFNNWISHTI